MSGVNAHAIITTPEESSIAFSNGYSQDPVFLKRSIRCFVEVLTWSHPLLQTATTPTKQQLHFKVPLDRPSLAFFWDHRVNGGAIMPGAAYLESTAAAASTLVKNPVATAAVIDAAILAPLMLPEIGKAGTAHLTVDIMLSSGVIAVRSAAGASSETSHLKGTLVNVSRLNSGGELKRVHDALASMEISRAACTEPQACTIVYEGLRAAGLQYGPRFR